MLFLRRIHANALAFVNAERIKAGREAINDFPMGFRNDEDENPVVRALGERHRPAPAEDWEFFLEALAVPSESACEAWNDLFAVGFYKEYDEARLYARRKLRRHQRMLRGVKDMGPDMRERYLRTKKLVEYAQKQL